MWIYKRASPKAVESNPASFGISQSPETLLAKLLKNAACCGFRLRPSLAANPQGRSQCIWKLCRNHWRFVPPPIIDFGCKGVPIPWQYEIALFAELLHRKRLQRWKERASSDQRTNHAGPLCFQGVRFEDLYRFSLSNDNFAPTCGELCWVLASIHFYELEACLWETTLSVPLWKRLLELVNTFVFTYSLYTYVFDGWKRVGTKVVANWSFACELRDARCYLWCLCS